MDVSFKFEPELDDDSGRGLIQDFTPGGSLIESAALDTRTVKRKGEMGASWRQPLAGGHLTLTSALRGERARTDTKIDASLSGGTSERVAEDEDLIETETGARFVRPLGTHAMKTRVSGKRQIPAKPSSAVTLPMSSRSDCR